MKPRIKVLMPKFEALRGISWAKELMLSFVGTSLSIILTFGTAHFVDEKQKRDEGRQTAMMVIHDIENSAELFRTYARDEETDFNRACDILSRKDQLDSISGDTLYSLLKYIMSPAISLYNYDDSSEKIFLSSPDAWKNIDNAAFIDAVQSFYRERRTIYAMLNSDRIFIRPITHDDYYDALIAGADKNGYASPTFMADLLREHIDRKDVQYYIRRSPTRRVEYSRISSDFTKVANKCKFLMGISDQELAEYVEQQEHNGAKLKDNILVGNWQIQSSEENCFEYRFMRDHTLTYINKQFIPNSFYTGSIEFDFVMSGTWDIQGDSLILVIQPGCELTFDSTHIRYQADQKEYLDRLVGEWQRSLEREIEQHKQGDAERTAYYGTIDATRNKIELTPAKEEDDNEPHDSFYILRVTEE